MQPCASDVVLDLHDGRSSFVAVRLLGCQHTGRSDSHLKSVFSDLTHAEQQIISGTIGTTGSGRQHRDLLQILRGAAESIRDSTMIESDCFRREFDDHSKAQGCNGSAIEFTIDRFSPRNDRATTPAGSIKESVDDLIAAIRAAKEALPSVHADCKTAEVGRFSALNNLEDEVMDNAQISELQRQPGIMSHDSCPTKRLHASPSLSLRAPALVARSQACTPLDRSCAPLLTCASRKFERSSGCEFNGLPLRKTSISRCSTVKILPPARRLSPLFFNTCASSPQLHSRAMFD